MSETDNRKSDSDGIPAGTPVLSSADEADMFDCWRKIGVEGDGSCRELSAVLHCRNCVVYSRAGRRILNRALPAEYQRERTEYFAQTRKPAAGSKISALIFRVGPEWLSLPTQAIQEVAEHRLVHSLPHRRHGVVLGLVNVRGELLLCVSVGRLLGLNHGASSEKLRAFYDRLLVVSWTGQRLAIPADEVRGIYRFQPDELAEPPTTVSRSTQTFTQGLFLWEGRPVGLFNPDLLLSSLNRSLS